MTDMAERETNDRHSREREREKKWQRVCEGARMTE